ncbi:hypothetical protein BOH78_4080 [Pichia kudriavzevii]|nr:hypothetical protein BOH78_4080 [Pichia kudriavzevii]
MVRVFS